MKSILLSITAFVSTNMDDLFINMLFFAQHNTKASVRSIVAGKYLGMGALTLISLLGAYGLQMLPGKWLSLLGLFPLALGVREIIRRSAPEDEMQPNDSRSLCLSMALITIANGADNIGVYLPLFAGFNPWQMGAAIAVFALMTGFWCLLSKRLTGMPVLQKLLAKYKPVLIPVVYILLGFYILLF